MGVSLIIILLSNCEDLLTEDDADTTATAAADTLVDDANTTLFNDLKKIAGDIDDIEVSPTYSRLKMLRMMKEAGIKGRTTGYNSKGLATHTVPIIEFNKRIIKPHFVPNISFEDVYSMKATKGYTWMLLEKIIQSTSTYQESYLLRVNAWTSIRYGRIV